MGFKIEDGTGRGYTLKVGSDNRAAVAAVIQTEISDVSGVAGEAYVWASGTYSSSGGDTILLVKNTGDTHVHISGIWLSCDTDTRAVIHYPAAEVTPTGTSITGTNLNTDSTNVATATAIRDETDNTQGLIIWSGEIYAASGPFYIDFQGSAILSKNKSIGVDYVAANTASDVSIMGHFL